MKMTDKEEAEINEAIKRVDNLLTFFVGVGLAFMLGIWIGISYQKNRTVPTETTEVIDSLTAVNDSIKIKVEKLDSIKNAKVIEVSTLDNDSTLKLFYELVSE